MKPTAYEKLQVASDSYLSLSMSAVLCVSAAKAIDLFTAPMSRDPAERDEDAWVHAQASSPPQRGGAQSRLGGWLPLSTDWGEAISVEKCIAEV